MKTSMLLFCFLALAAVVQSKPVCDEEKPSLNPVTELPSEETKLRRKRCFGFLFYPIGYGYQSQQTVGWLNDYYTRYNVGNGYNNHYNPNPNPYPNPNPNPNQNQ